MASRIDDKLFVALLRGDREALAAGWTMAFACALDFAVRLFGGEDVCIAGQSAEDVASLATEKFVQKVASGQVNEGNVYAYLMRAVYTTFVDATRTARRYAVVADWAADGDGPSLDLFADPAPTQEQALLVREDAEARWRAQLTLRRAALRDWCLWPDAMMPRCGRRAALVAMLEQMKGYLGQQVALARSGAGDGKGLTLLQLAETAELVRVCYSFGALNEFLLGRLGITRTALDQRWKYLRKIARDHGLPLPPGLHGNNGAETPERPASRPTEPPALSSEGAAGSSGTGDGRTSTPQATAAPEALAARAPRAA